MQKEGLCTYKDDFNVTFEEESAFYKYLDDVEKRAEWFRAQSKDLTVEAVTKDSTCTPDWEYQSGIFK